MNNYCLIGYGRHLKNKIIPALKNINANIVGIITSQNVINDDFTKFSSISEAIFSIPKDTIFIISSPPEVHFKQAKFIMNNNFNIFIEKPITIKKNGILKLIEISKKNKVFMVENFMYFYSKKFQEFNNEWLNKESQIKKVYINFIIPYLPTKTFRSNIQNYPINLYDMGCYPLSLLNKIKSYDNKINIMKITNKLKTNKEIIYLQSNLNIDYKIKFGVGLEYQNNVKIFYNNGDTSLYEPFFYGRKNNVKITRNQSSINSEVIFNEDDSFEILFSKSNEYWIKSQPQRNEDMIRTLSMLENLSKQYNDYK